MKAKSIKGKTAREIEDVLKIAISEGFLPTVAVVFNGIENELGALDKVLSAKNIQIFGASSGSNFIDGEIESDFIAILLLDIAQEQYKIELVGSEAGTTSEIAAQIGRQGLAGFNKPEFLIISGGLTTDGDEIIEGIENACGKGTTIFGGLAADALKMQRTYVFTNGRITDNGLLALIFDGEKIDLNGLAIGGWRPVGMERTITRSRGNVLYAIDNEPALDFITRYSGIKTLVFDNALNSLLSSNFQLQLQRENKHPVMRTPMYANPDDHSIVFAASVPEGSRIRLCLLPGFEVIEESLSEFRQYKKEQTEADAMLMFSCAGRQLSLGPFASEEINGVKDIWDVPMAGFFCFGEIGRVINGSNEFHNMTCSLALLKEK